MPIPRRRRRQTDVLRLCFAFMTHAAGAFAPDYSSVVRTSAGRRRPSFVQSYYSARCPSYTQPSRQFQRGSILSVAPTISSISVPSSSALGSVEAAAATTSEISTATADVLSTSDVVIGTILAFALAFGYSFLNGQSSSSSFISWRSQVTLDSSDTSSSMTSNESDFTATQANNSTRNGDDKQVFDAEAWREISRPENYVWYNSRIRDDGGKQEDDDDGGYPGAKSNEEQKWVVIALLALFVPIFSVEFFFALSRQFMCGGDVFTQPEWAQQLCSPYLGR
uniref:Uncharacterized protein n=1 Tax=Odontella aurita TaxID=265563 RepID=A0A7S4K5V2_9STRA|mmetsp:Transcript_61685/g.182228  ORF Transcript_61685/g.182228 Transcript_61685/m.182228 type:complete len:280 (+) Transcript_61685:279-1118(+)|eukprot:CAMPEP_0113550302 /NCGR_PEP_ID=MMETSP0015_2-20120614/13910_1 /TAXON_ID=2838 /ORGANISM="Odontella" /LENGTH=279 /DNA_ID=CAMNT_0000451101 /DNA_START=267 /DNA_END=1109 /DNA_ORIENTATION=- /assembly_acc=CAM_ASM_000160